ncbi:MAG: hypothetical protein IM613_12240 [Cytophagales bacterium]|nr:hypothetical protein [Cytophagales bacterium]
MLYIMQSSNREELFWELGTKFLHPSENVLFYTDKDEDVFNRGGVWIYTVKNTFDVNKLLEDIKAAVYVINNYPKPVDVVIIDLPCTDKKKLEVIANSSNYIPTIVLLEDISYG